MFALVSLQGVPPNHPRMCLPHAKKQYGVVHSQRLYGSCTLQTFHDYEPLQSQTTIENDSK